MSPRRKWIVAAVAVVATGAALVGLRVAPYLTDGSAVRNRPSIVCAGV